MAIMQCSKLQFLFANEQKQLARVLPESSAVICAKFGRVRANSTATQEKRLSFFGAITFFVIIGKPQRVFAGRATQILFYIHILRAACGFFKKSPTFLIKLTHL